MAVTSTESPRSADSTHVYDVLVVGGGFAGVHQLRHLRDRGFSVLLLEASGAFGGVWSLNRYPGARVDSHGPVYQFTDEFLWKDWQYSEMFPGHEELRQYFEYVDSKLQLSKDCRFNCKVVDAQFDESCRLWELKSQDGTLFTTRFVVMATGSTTEPYTPNIPGLERFRGEVVHTARWREDIEMSDKRIAIIGTGASGVQVIQEAGPVARHLTVFQRTPNIALPMQQRRLDDEENAAIKEQMPAIAAKCKETFAAIDYDFDPRKAVETSPQEREEFYEYVWNKGGFAFWLGTFSDTFFNEEANAMAYDFWRRKTLPLITDPVKAEMLVPETAPHPFGGKRPALYQNYYEVMNQNNVQIASIKNNPIVEITESGIRTADGTEWGGFDMIILATGFDNNTGALTSIDLRNADRVTLRDKWRSGVDAYLGAFTNRFPNMLFLYGPQSPAAFANGSTNAELQGDVVIDFLEFLRSNGHTRFESTAEADTAWTAEISEVNEIALFKYADSWYNGGNIPGKHRQFLQYPKGLPVYLNHWRAEEAAGYALGLKVT